VQSVRRSAICSTSLPLVFKLSTGAFFVYSLCRVLEGLIVDVFTPCGLCLHSSDAAQCLKVAVREKPDLPEAYHECSTCEFGAESWGPPFPQKKN